MTGLSGVSDIVGDMLRRGDIDAAQAGISQQEAQLLQDKARYVPNWQGYHTNSTTSDNF